MMKWKVVKNPRSASADRSLECLRNDVKADVKSDSNNNVGEEGFVNKDTAPPVKDTNRQRDISLSRKPSVVATDCLNLKSFLGLSRQRSETNLSSLGLFSTEPRRSRSEVRGLSCDRLAVGYQANPTKAKGNGHTRSSSPPSKASCWIRGRKREREPRNPVKNNADVSGKTVVTGCNGKKASSKTRNGEGRTIVDGSDGKVKKVVSTKSSLDIRKNKHCKRSEDDIIEEEVIYTEIENNDVQRKLLEVNKEAVKDPKKVIRKKGLAPKPQIATALFKETSGIEVNLNPYGGRQCGSPNSLNELPQIPPCRKPQRKNQTYSGRNQDRKNENRVIQTVKLNNLKNNNVLFKNSNNTNIRPVIAVAEIHKEVDSSQLNNDSKCDERPENNTTDNPTPSSPSPAPEAMQVEESGEPLPYHIDTPDYSTLDSVTCCSYTLTEDTPCSKEDAINSNTDCDESIQETITVITPENAVRAREISLSSILRDTSNDNKGLDSEPKKTVRFEKLDLIEKYKKHKTETLMDMESEGGASESMPILDVNCNEIVPSDVEGTTEIHSPCSENNEDVNSADMTVNVLVRNSSPVPKDPPASLVSPNPFVVKKSFVITVAKQERGFRSLCATRKLEVQPEQTKNGQQISVTFLCSGPPTESWVNSNEEESLQYRSISVPPRRAQPPPEVVPVPPALRGRSRERRPKDRPLGKKNNKTKKKEAPVFVMPQAVIDELSQVLEKRNPPCSAR